MFGVDLAALPIWANGLIFLVAAVIVWAAGSRLSPLVDAISDKTGLGQAFSGMLLLGVITCSPEIATVSTASLYGNAPLATNNLLGSLSVNIVLLTVGDATVRRYALTSVVAGPATMLQGALGIIMLAVVAAAILVGDRLVLGIGIWATLICILAVLVFWLASRFAERARWRADRSVAETEAPLAVVEAGRRQSPLERWPLRKLVLATCLLAVLILVSGYTLARTGDVLAVQTGLGASFVGLVLVAFATSLPELSVILSAVRIRRFEMAIGDVFGANVINLALIALADAFYFGRPVLNEAGRFEAVAALLGLILTTIYLVGLLERRDRTILGLGYDSLVIIGVYIGGLVVLYGIS